MAEYYPLLARAVSAQPNATPETRNGIYERARKALLGQLRAHEPPVAEDDIERERRALEEAIARIEAEQIPTAARPPAAPSKPKAATPTIVPVAAAQPAAPAGPAAEAPAPSGDAATPPLPDAALEPGPASRNSFVRKPPLIPPRRPPQRPVMAPVAKRFGTTAPTPPNPDRTDVSESTAPEVRANRSPEPGATAPAIEREAASAPERGPAPAVIGAEKLAAPSAERSIPRSGILRKFGRPRVGIADTGPLVVPDPDAGQEEEGTVAEPSSIPLAAQAEPDFEPAPARPETMRPTAPLAHVERRRPILAWALGALAAVLVACVAVLAFALRDNPKTLVAKKPIPIQDADKTPGKIVDRIGVGPTRLSRVPAPGALAEGAAGAAAGPAAGTPGPAAPATPAPAPNPAAAQNPAANPSVPVAQRAALLIQAPTANDAQAIATYVGSVVWRLDTVSPGPDQPVALAVRAEFDVPDAKFKGSMLFQRNSDATLPASHTIELRFSAGPGSPIGVVRQIDTPQMRKEDSPAGDPLSGIPAPITQNYFLVGLTKGDPAEARNVDLMRTRAWFDVPMLLANGKIAKITFEKGVSGDKALNDALDSWAK